MILKMKHMDDQNYPVFVDNNNDTIDYSNAVKALLIAKKWTYQDLANHTGYSKRTAEGWGQDRIPPKPALIIISHLLS